MSIGFFFREAFRALRRNAAPSMAATVTIVITVTVLGVCIPVLMTTQGKTDEVREQIMLDVYLFDDATDEEVVGLRDRIAGMEHVAGVQYISKEEALTILEGRLGEDKRDIVRELPANPLPASFKIQLANPGNLDDVRAALQPPDARGQAQPISPIIDEVKDSREEASKILAVTNALKIILAVIAALLVVASLLLVANTIRLSIYARRREVEVMRLVGATNWFIRWPFVVEGVVVGFAGGVVAVVILWLGKVTIVDPLSDRFALVAAQSTIDFLPLVALLLAGATVVSALGSGVTLRRFLRV